MMKLIAFMSSYTNQGTYWLQGHENSISLSRQASVNKTEQEKSRQRSYSVRITKISPVKNCILKINHQGHAQERGHGKWPWKVGKSSSYPKGIEIPQPWPQATKNKSAPHKPMRMPHHQRSLPVNYKRPTKINNPYRRRGRGPRRHKIALSNRSIFAHRHQRIDQEQASRERDRLTAKRKKKETRERVKFLRWVDAAPDRTGLLFLFED
jgi:hypothetical protein